jgi:hypothetical protein
MAKTQAIYYRDERGVEPVDSFIEGLSAKRAAKIDDHIEEHLIDESRMHHRRSFRSARR